MFNLIVAMNPTGIIGLGDRIPWRVPEDLAYFRKMTLGKPIIMGRKTFASLPNQQPLPNRTNLVLTRDDNLNNYESEEKYIKMDDISNIEEGAFVIGGGEIYRELLPRCNKIYATIVYWEPPANDDDDDEKRVYFPKSMTQLMMEYIIESESEMFVSKVSGIQYKFMVLVSP